jgi:hypothetical protein
MDEGCGFEKPVGWLMMILGVGVFQFFTGLMEVVGIHHRVPYMTRNDGNDADSVVSGVS